MGHPGVEGPGRHRQGGEQGPAAPRQTEQIGVDHPGEGDVGLEAGGGVLREGQGMAGEAFDQEGATPPFADDDPDQLLGSWHRAEQRARQLGGVAVAQGLDRQLPAAVAVDPRQQVGEESAGLDLLSTKTDDQEHRRRIGRPLQIVEQGDAVGVGPLQVVDVEHQGLSRRQPGEQLAQGGEGEAALGPAVEVAARSRLDPGDRRHPQEHGEQTRQEADVARQAVRSLLCRKGDEDLAEGVDHPVEGLVGHQLPLVAAPRQHPGPRSLDQGGPEEGMGEGGLP